MKELLKIYSGRLIDLSSRNSSLCLTKLYSKRSFDIYNLKKLDDDKLFYNNFIEFLFNKDEEEFDLIGDLDSIHSVNTRKIKEQSSLDSSYEKELYDKGLQNEEEKYKYGKSLYVDLKNINKEIKQFEKETGRYELFLGIVMVEGKLKEKEKYVKAPLILFPISLDTKLKAVLIKMGKPIWNNVLLKAISTFNELDFQLDRKSLELPEVTSQESLFEYAKSYLHEIGISVHTSSTEFSAFEDVTDERKKSFMYGELFLHNNIILGNFPIANSIYYDYENLIENGSETKLLNKLLKVAADTSFPEMHEDSFLENNTILITPLDSSQENAVKSVSENKDLVIFGPPGTGKSQTIANIIADNLYKGRKVLVVSQKRAALDVLYNRLSMIQPLLALIHDAKKDRKKFYKQIEGHIESNSRIMEKSEEIIKLGNDIDNKVEALRGLLRALDKDTGFGISYGEMLANSHRIESDDMNSLKRMSSFSQNEQLMKTGHKDLNSLMNDIKTSNIAKDYYEYQKIIEKNDLYADVLADYDFALLFSDLNDFESFSNYINNFESFGSEISQDYLEMFGSESFTLEEKNILDYALRLADKKYGYLNKELKRNKSFFKRMFEHKTLIKKERENKIEFEARLNEFIEQITCMNNVKNELMKKYAGISSLFTEAKYSEVLICLVLNAGRDNILKLLYDFKDQHTLNLSIDLKFKLKTLDNIEKILLDFNYNKDLSLEEYNENISGFENIAMNVWINKVEREDNNLKCLNFEDRNGLVQQIKELQKKKYELTPDTIISKWRNKPLKGERDITVKIKRKKDAITIRKLIENYQDTMLTLYPCWLLSPETVSDIMPFKDEIFDLVIFDEASQLFVEESIPSIYRSKQIVVAGDDKQLQPSALFSGRVPFAGITKDEEEEEDVPVPIEIESLLDLAKNKLLRCHINVHYRSKYEELINFSNYAFYNGALKIAPNTTKDTENLPIERIMLSGIWENNHNVIEAEKTVELIAKILNKRKDNETIGVITFNIQQKNLIEETIDKKCNQDEIFREKYTKESERVNAKEDVSIFIKNIENVQGDERDIIIFSIAYGKNEKGEISTNFGLLNQARGENRLNVAVSRAKKKIYLITSFEPEDIKVEKAENQGPALFKAYLSYVRAVSSGNQEEYKRILYSLCIQRPAVGPQFDSPFEEEVFNKLDFLLKAKNLELEAQVGDSGYRIDMAIYNPTYGRYILGIECDGASYHSTKSARERDIHRQVYLESRGWKIARIWSRDWWKNSDLEIKKIMKTVELLESKLIPMLEPEPKLKPKLVPMQGQLTFELTLYLKKNNIKYIDMRIKEGCLWILKDDIETQQIKELQKMGYKLIYTEKGGKTTNHKPSYYIK